MIAYRDATAADGPALDAMARQSAVDTFAADYAVDDFALYLAEAYGPEGGLLHDLADGRHRFRLAVDDAAIAGYAKLSPVWLDQAITGAGAVQLSQLYIATPWLGQGVGKVLMAWALDTARAHGATALVLTVWEHNPRARRFYDRYGFVHVGDYSFRTGNQIDRDLIMRLAL